MVNSTQGNAESFEMGILAFGTSVTVTDEVRRSVEKETEVLEESIQQLRSKIKTEEKVGEELRRSRLSSGKETRDILQGSTENLSSLNFTVDFLQELHKSFTLELMDTTAEPSADDTTKHLYGIAMVDIQAEMAEQQRELDTLHEEGLAHVQSLSSVKEKKVAVTEEMETLKRRIVEDKLEEQNTEWDAKIRLAKHEFDNEMNRQRSLIANLDDAKKQNDALEQEKRKLLTELDENTAALQSEEEVREKHQSEMEKEKLDKQVVLQRLHSESSSNALRIAELKAHLEEAKKLVDIREQLKTKREAARAMRLELHNEKKTLEIELASSKELAAKAKAEDLMVEDSLQEVDLLRQQNDETQAKQVLPGEREYESLLQQELELKSLIGDGQNDSSFTDLRTTIDNLQQRLDDVKKECSEYSAELEKKMMEKDELDAKAESQQNSASAAIQVLQEELSTMKEDNTKVENSINGLRRKIHDKSGGKELAMLKQKLRIFQSGADLLKSTAKKEKSILNHDSDHFD
ncbi:hypothetical protein FisN_7Lh322 [Fistulifera solaris]|uniref:Uncharacterized protein n=1 Tax=Fistulifera solaris TaxID=1519565 RepID=A0A1Z5JS47_FISSO|nr:hypothetical protein FisN_7Lh322 [Fistulifera solaris]|eukprot:GAX16591.1 hypothetical protein FisN_7Lh322 [Fistulifera solaris]